MQLIVDRLQILRFQNSAFEPKTPPASEASCTISRLECEQALAEASDPSENVTTKARNVAPRIDRHAIHEIRVKAGQAFALDIPVSGEPQPGSQ